MAYGVKRVVQARVELVTPSPKLRRSIARCPCGNSALRIGDGRSLLFVSVVIDASLIWSMRKREIVPSAEVDIER